MSATSDLGPAQLAVLIARFTGVAHEMGEVLRRAASSPNIKERADCSAALFTADGTLLVQAEHIPVHLGSMPASVAAAIEAFGDQVGPDDQVILNDPFAGGTHLNDVTVVAPVFVDGAIAGWVANRAHHADLGGTAPGSMPADAVHIDQEGLRLPPTLLTDIRPDMDIYREETFGPVLPVIRVRDEEEAVRLANASEFGLVGSVWTQDLEKGLRIASRLESGQVMVNDVYSSVGHPGLPFGGVRSSGIGRYHGDEGLLSFMNTKAILVDRGKADYDPIWYPYNNKLASAFEVFRGVAGKKLGSVIRGFLGLRKASIDGHDGK